MATFTDNEAQVRAEFRSLKTLFDQLKTSYFFDKPWFDTLSMGMSDDYRIAIEEGSTMIDVTGMDVHEGDTAEIFGKGRNISELADSIGTISYELLTNVSRRVKRVYFQE